MSSTEPLYRQGRQPCCYKSSNNANALSIDVARPSMVEGATEARVEGTGRREGSAVATFGGAYARCSAGARSSAGRRRPEKKSFLRDLGSNLTSAVPLTPTRPSAVHPSPNSSIPKLLAAKACGDARFLRLHAPSGGGGRGLRRLAEAPGRRSARQA
jgi:hypothetical protein